MLPMAEFGIMQHEKVNLNIDSIQYWNSDTRLYMECE